MCLNQSVNCNCDPTCLCSEPCICIPEPCDTTGCITDTRTDCTFLDADLDLCGDIIPAGSTLTEALTAIGTAVCDGVTVTVLDNKVKVSANDTTNGYLDTKLVEGNGITKTILTPSGNETLEIKVKKDIITNSNDNILQIGANGLYVPPPVPGSYVLTPLFSQSILLTVANVVGGQSILASAKIDSVTGSGDNILVSGVNGLYVPPPASVTPITVSGSTGITGINNTIAHVGSDYKVTSTLLIDPASTGTISLSALGLRVDCCSPATLSNTPITITPTTSITFTATGTDNHTLSCAVKKDTVTNGGDNILQLTANGVYVPPTSLTTTTIQDTATVDAVLVSPNTYDLNVKQSTDSCNALVLGSDNSLYVNGVSEPYSLKIYKEGADLKFSFKGPTTVDTDYTVEFQGTTGSPSTWIPGVYDSQNIGTLVYIIGTPIDCYDISARVKYTCGTNDSDWVGVSYDPLPTFVSASGTIAITETGNDCNELSLDLDCASCAQYNPAFTYNSCGPDYVTITIASIPANVVGLQYEFKLNGGVIYGQGEVPGVDGVYRLHSSVPINIGDAIRLRFRSVCEGGCVSSWGAFFGTNVGGYESSVVCETPWTLLDASALVSTGGYSVSLSSAFPPYYRNHDGQFELAGNIVFTVTTHTAAPDTGGTTTAYVDIIDFTSLNCNTVNVPEEEFGVVYFSSIGTADYESGAGVSTAPKLIAVSAKRVGTMLSAKLVRQDVYDATVSVEIPLSALNIHL